MTRSVDAVYEKGVLRPLEPLDLAESQRVHLTVSTVAAGKSQRDWKLLEEARAEAAALPTVPSLEEIRQMLSAIPGSLADDFAAEREDR